VQYDGSRGTELYYGKAIYISTGDYTTDSSPGGVAQLSRIQSVDWAVSYPVDFSLYTPGVYDPYLKAPAGVSLTLRWLNTSAVNEYLIGLGQYNASGVLTYNLDAQKSLYMTVENTPGVDAIGASGAGESKTVLGFAQGVLTQFLVTAAVGGVVECQGTFDYLTSYIYSGAIGQPIPAVNYTDGSQVTGVFSLPAAQSLYVQPEPSGVYSTGIDYTSAIAATELIMTFPVGSPYGISLTGAQSCYLQSFTCNLAFPRLPMQNIGSQFPFARPVNYPIRVDLSTEAIVSQYQMDQLQRISCLGTGQYVNIIVKQPCSNATLFGLYFTELQLIEQDFVTSIGRNDVVSLKWRGVISNPFQTFFDPTVNFIVQLSNTGAWGTQW
jgi:hypothetical protein